MEMEAENVSLSDSESTTGSNSDSNPVANGPPAPPTTRFRCSHCSNLFSSELELHEHQSETNQVNHSIARLLVSVFDRNPHPHPPPPPPPPPKPYHIPTRLAPQPTVPLFHANGAHGVGNSQRYHPYVRPPRETFQFFPAPRDDDYVHDSSGRTMDLLSLFDQSSGSVPKQQFPEPSRNGANESVAAQGAPTRSDSIDLDLKL